MTVPELDFHSTDNLISPLKFYPAEIHVPHHQLRNFISTAYENKVFFVHNFDIFVLDTQKQQLLLIATVPFEARCLAANHGWVCVGGETKGDCAFVKIGEGDADPGHFGHDLTVDMLGKEIVNSMTIHRIPGRAAGHTEETVVLISNNDKSVTLYSLSQQEVLCVLPHPVPMNYASMSPDCTIIAAVGDSNEVYFYQRQDAENPTKARGAPTRYQEYNWRPFAVPQIPAGEGIFDDFSFAIAFSPSGRLCAVSAQGGTISVFDMRQLVAAHSNAEAESAIVCTFRSSRASLFGCVRSLSFSPEPWDLLAWTEDHGTIGIADIRRSFVRRQCVSLDREAAELVNVENITSSEYHNMDVKERLKYQYMLRASRGHPPIGARSLDEGHGQTIVPGSLNQESAELNAQERSVFEALETAIDDVEQYPLHPYSVNYVSSPNIRPSVASADQRRQHDVQPLGPGSTLRGPPAPRRRQSVVLSDPAPNRHLSPPEPSQVPMTASPAPLSDADSTPPVSTNDLTPTIPPSTHSLPFNIPVSDQWHLIEASLAADRATTSAVVSGEPPASLTPIDAAIQAERQLTGRLERLLSNERRFSDLVQTELMTRERLYVSPQSETESDGARNGRLSPSIEQVLRQQLQSEQEHGRQRSNEIESETRGNAQRIERLLAERDSILRRVSDTEERSTTSGTLPNNTASSNSHSSRTQEVETILRQMDDEHHARRQRIQDLEVQARRAGNRLGWASFQSVPENTRDRHERMADARFLTSTIRPGHTLASLRRAQQMDQYGVPFGTRSTSSSTSAYTSRLRAAAAAARRAEATVSDARSTLPRASELAGRVSENDMRLARRMLHAAVMDANGNWVAEHALRRNHDGLSRTTTTTTTTGGLPARAAAMQDTQRDRGVGTAGIGWSLDGGYL